MLSVDYLDWKTNYEKSLRTTNNPDGLRTSDRLPEPDITVCIHAYITRTPHTTHTIHDTGSLPPDPVDRRHAMQPEQSPRSLGPR